MDSPPSEEVTALCDAFDTFLAREVAPKDQAFTVRCGGGPLDEQAHADLAALRRRSCAAGFYAPHMPEHAGDQGLGVLGTSLLVECAAHSGSALAPYLIGPPNPWAPSPLLGALPDGTRNRYLPALMDGSATMCFALTEPEAGSDVAAMMTRAVRVDGGWLLNGVKHYITNGDKADVAVVFAVTDAKARSHGVTAFLVPKDDFHVAKIDRTMVDDHDPAELVFADCFVPDDHVIGPPGDGFRAAMRFLDAGRVYIAARCLGLAEWCLDAAVRHAQSRRAFGGPLGSLQSVAFALADAKVTVEAIRGMVSRAAIRLDAGEDARVDAAMPKYFSTEQAFHVADACQQVFGGMGLLREGRIEAVTRQLRMFRIVEGASEVQKVLIGRSLGLAGELRG